MSTNVQSAYKLEWMDSCLHETLLPGSPWHKVHQQSCKVFFMQESFIYRLSHDCHIDTCIPFIHEKFVFED